jgi:hypothetical protein
MRVRLNRATERAGVNAAQSFFESHDQIFQPVSLENDFGKDAYVDFVKDRTVLGTVAALQIKSGTSFARSSGYAIPVDHHLTVWRESTVPVIGIVHDPDDGGLYWVNISMYLESAPETVTSIPVSSSARLTTTSLSSQLIPSVRASIKRDALANALLNLCSRDEGVQASSVYDCFATGRNDVRVLITIRNALRSLQGKGLQSAIVALSHATSHPDIYYGETNSISTEARKGLEPHLQWTAEEIALMLRAIPWSEGWDRGTLGQCVFHLLIMDQHHRQRMESAMELLKEDPDALFAAMYLCVYWSEAPHLTFTRLLAQFPELSDAPLSREVQIILAEHGQLSLF